MPEYRRLIRDSMGRHDPLVSRGPLMPLRKGTVLQVEPDPFLPDDTFFRCQHNGPAVYVRSDDTEPCGEDGGPVPPAASHANVAQRPLKSAVNSAPSEQGQIAARPEPGPPEQRRRETVSPLDEVVPSPPAFEHRRRTEEHSPSVETPSREDQPAKREVVLPDQVPTPARPSPDANYAKANAFAAIGFPGLSATQDLRRASERAQIQQKMARDARPDGAASSLERLVSDPTFRMREAAAWYFAFGTADGAAASNQNSLASHDAVLVLWHSFLDELARGNYDSGSFSEACEATAKLIANPADWQPLHALVDEIADVRLGSNTVSSAAEAAVARWISEALFAVAATEDPANTREAAEIEFANDYGSDTVDAFGGKVDAAIDAKILNRAAEELSNIAAAHEATTQTLLDRIAEDPSVADELVSQAEELVRASRPWWELVEVFDEDPDSGAEGHALDRVAGLLKSVGVSLANAQDYARAYESLQYAHEIAQSNALRLSLESDIRLVRYLRAYVRLADAVKTGDGEAARSSFSILEKTATTDEDRQNVARLRPVVSQLQSRRSRTSGAGLPWGKIVWAVIAAGVILSIIIGAIWGSDDDSSSSSSLASSRNVPAAGSTGSSSSGSSSGEDRSSSSLDVERLAIERERARLDDAEDDLETLGSQIDRLSRQLDNTDASYPNGLPQRIFDQYEADRLRHNRLVAQYNSLLDEYNDDLDEFNRRVDEYNRR